MEPGNQCYPWLTSTDLDPGVHLLILIFGLVVRPVLLLWRLHPGGEEALLPPNKGPLRPHTRLSRPVNTRQILEAFSCFPWVHSCVLNGRFAKEKHSPVASQTSARSASPHWRCPVLHTGAAAQSPGAEPADQERPFHDRRERNNFYNNIIANNYYLLIKTDRLNFSTSFSIFFQT